MTPDEHAAFMARVDQFEALLREWKSADDIGKARIATRWFASYLKQEIDEIEALIAERR